MADNKWIAELREDMPALTAARQVLLARLTAVRERLPQAVSQADQDVEHVHQLRVSSRRAAAALRIFAEFLPPKAYKKTRKRLRTVRRAAGAARDWDVFLEVLAARQAKVSSRQQAGLDLLLGIGHGQRMAAQEGLVTATKDLNLEAVIAATLSALREDTPPPFTLRDLAMPMLTELFGDFEKAARGDLGHYQELHQVRILGKRLRYAMEVFEPCFEPAFREEYYPAVEHMQEILGQANDSHVAVGRLEAIRTRVQTTQPHLWKRYQAGIEALLRYHRNRLPRQRHLFEDWWADWQKAGTEAALARLLKSGSAIAG